MSAWELALLVVKWVIYLGQAAATGGVLMAAAIAAWYPRETLLARIASRHLLAAGSLGLVAVVVSFFLHTGTFADAGVRGMLDRDLLRLLWDSPIGSSSVLRAFGIALPLTAFMLSFFPSTITRRWLLCPALYMTGLALTGWSFTQVGHIADMGHSHRILIALHAVIALCWAGALYPLWLACDGVAPAPLKNIMHRFGSLALWLVLLLLSAGTVLLWVLLGAPLKLLNTPYGLAFIFKLLLVLAIVSLAALHRWRLVPSLADDRSSHQLRRSIALEAFLVAAVLMLTALLSSFLGPP